MEQLMIRSNVTTWPPHRYRRKVHRRILELKQWLVRRIEIRNGSSAYRFRCESGEPNWAPSLPKELALSLDHLGDRLKVFYDVGANIGVSHSGSQASLARRQGVCF
jgi:hypothetical protein